VFQVDQVVQGDLYQVQVHEALKETLATVGTLANPDAKSAYVPTGREAVSSENQFFPSGCCCSADSAGLVAMGSAGTLLGVFEVGLNTFVGVACVRMTIGEVCGDLDLRKLV
jgi:hypothetical protein